MADAWDNFPDAPRNNIAQNTTAADPFADFPDAAPVAANPAPVSDPYSAFPDAGVQTPPPAAAPPEKGFFETRIADPLGRGWNTLQQGFDIGQAMTGIDPVGAMERWVENEQDKAAYPIDPGVAAGTREIQEAEGFWPATKAIVKNPGAVGNVVVESLASSLPSLTLGAAGGIGGAAAGTAVAPGPGTLVGSVAGAMTGTAAGSFATEFTNTISSELAESGVDVNDPEALAAMLENPEFRERVVSKATNRAGAIAAFDALSMGLAGRVAKPARALAKTGTGKAVAGAGAEVATQAVLGSGGEASAQLASEGQITSPGDVLLEAAGEVVPGAIEAGINVRQDIANQRRANAQAQTNPPLPPGAVPPPSAAPSPQAMDLAIPSAPPSDPAVLSQPAEPIAQVTPESVAEPQVTPPVENVIPAPAAEKPGRKKIVTPNNSMEVDADNELVDLANITSSDMAGYPQDRQPRDRTSKRSEAQIGEIVSNFDPERLGDSRTSDQGAPIIGPEAENIVESGNGRIMSLRRIYNEDPERALAYRNYLQKQGYDTTGMQQPVLVRRRATPLDNEQLRRFVEDSNRDAKMAQNETEIAAQDAGRLTPDIISMYKGGSLQAGANQDFRNAIIKNVIGSEAEASGMRAADGSLSQAGERRVRAAMFAYAYQSPQAVENFYTSADPEMKSVGDVMQDVAPAYAAVRANIEARGLGKEYDIAKDLTDALDVIRGRKESGLSMSEHLNQADMLNGGTVRPTVEKIIRGLYNKDLTRLGSKKQIDTFLRGYADKVKDFDPNQGDLMGDGQLPNPSQILDQLLQARDAGGAMQPRLTDRADAAETSRAEAAEPADLDSEPAELQDNRRFPRGGYKQSTDPKELAATSGRDFSGFAYNDTANTRKNAYIDLGLDIDRAMNMPAAARLKMVRDAMADKFGMKVNVDNRMDAKLALDHMMDMYNSIAFMANVMGLPPVAIGLNNTLTLNIAKNGPYLGVYKPGEQSIGIPNKGNSFAHEWLHAFDHFILMREGAVQGADLFSGVVRKDGIDPFSGSRGSFVNLMNKLFFDKSQLAAVALQAQDKVDNGRTDRVRAEGQRILDEIARGNYKGVKAKSDYYKGAKTFGKNSSYWTEPEEMLARAYEAYISHKVAVAGGDVKGIAKGDLAYLSNADERLAQTFPKASERFEIFAAFDQLFNDVKIEQILGENIGPENLPDMDLGIVDPKHWDRLNVPKDQRNFIRRIIDQEKAAFEASRDLSRRLNEKAQAMTAIGLVKKNEFMQGVRAFQQNAFRAMRAVIHSMERRNPQSRAMREANDRLVTRPGAGLAVAQVFAEELESMTAKYQNRIDNIMKNFDIASWSDAEVMALRDEMQGRPKAKKIEKISKAATALRTVFDGLYDEAKKAGIDIGYLRDTGYLTRMYLDDVILAKKDEFLEKAAEVYGLQFDQDIGDVDAIIEKPKAFLESVQELWKRDKSAFTADKKTMQEIFSLLQNEDRTDAETDKLRDMLNDVLDDIRTLYGSTAASDWLTRIEVGHAEDIESKSPNAGFTKKRALPPEADVILKDFMEVDPVAIARSYAEKMAKKIAVHNVKTPKNGTSLEKLYQQMLKDGVSKNDVRMLRQYHDKIMGVEEQGVIQQAIAPMMEWLYTFGTVMLLARAVFSSLSEPMVTAVRTGSVLDAARYFKYTLDQIRKTEDAETFNAASRFIGLVANDMVAQSIDARMGGGLGNSKASRRILSNFFRKTMLTPLTNHQRQVVLRISYRYFQTLTENILSKDTSPATKAQAKRELAEYGIPADQSEAFAQWMNDFEGFMDPATGMPSDKLETPFGQMMMTGLRRFNKQTVQDPKREDRPYLATTPMGQVIYSVTAFSFSFWENVVKAQARKIKNTKDLEGGYEAAKQAGGMIAGFAALYGATFLVQSARLALFDHEKWDELDKKDELMNFLLQRSLSYTGFTGPVLDFLANAATGVKYQRDLATSFTGAHLSSYFDFLQKLTGLFVNNSENTNTAERNAVKSTFRTVVGPAVAMGMSLAPGGSVLGPLTGLGIMGVTSNSAADTAADVIVGEKTKKKKKFSGEGMNGLTSP